MKLKNLIVSLLLLSLMGCSLFSPAASPTPSGVIQSSPTSAEELPLEGEPSGAPAATPTPVSAQADLSADATDYPPGEPFVVTFDQPMNPGSANPALITYPWVEGEAQWDDSYTRLSFSPSQGFQPESVYRIFLNDNLKSESGGGLQETPQWEIHVRPAPQLTNRQPMSTQLDDRRPTIKLTFDRPMNLESLRNALQIQPQMAFEVQSVEDNAVEIHLLDSLAPGARYHFTLDASAADREGVALGADYRWDYSLPPLAEIATSPDPDDPHSPVNLTFDYDLQQVDLDRFITISAQDGPVMPGAWSWQSGRRASFTSAEAFLHGQVYTIAFNPGLQDKQGDPLPPPDPLSFTTPPPISSVEPAPGQSTDVSTQIKIAFSIPMDHELTAAALSTQPSLKGEVTWQGETMIFQPSVRLEEFTDYTVTLDTGAADIQGRPILIEPFSWTFNSGVMDLIKVGATFGERGPNAQVLDAAGRRAIQFATTWSEVTFELYRLTLEQFLDRYASGFRGVAGYENAAISLEGTSLAKSWSVSLSGQGYGWMETIHETIIPGDVEPGLYILNLKSGPTSDQLILALTRNTIMVKQAEGQLIAWVTEINGGPRPNVRLSVYARDGSLISQGRADENGVYRAQVARDPQPLIVVAQENEDLTGADFQGTDITVSGLSNEWRQGYNTWWNWASPAPQAQDYAVHIYTERPIYRPGQRVYFKAVLRLDEDAAIEPLPEGTPVTLRVRDARDNVVQTFNLESNPFGTVNGQFDLSEGAMLGDYNLEVELEGERHSQRFKVQDYRKPDYQITLNTEADEYVTGDPLTLEGDVAYFFGQPVPNAQVTLKRYLLVPRYVWGGMGDEQEDNQFNWATYGEEVKKQTDAQGHFAFSPMTAEVVEGDGYDAQFNNIHTQTWGLEVTVDDGSHQTVSNFTVYTVHSAAANLSMDPGDFFKTQGEPFSVQAAITSLQGEPLADRSLALEVRDYDSQNYQWEIVLQRLEMSSDAQGQTSTTVTLEKSGYYQLRLNATDPRGNEMYLSQWVYVIGERDSWASNYQQDLRISADRDTYQAGETARLAIESPFSGPALLTFERGRVGRVIPVRLTEPITLVEVPIQESDAPNIFVAVNAWEPQDTHLIKEMYQSLPDSRLRSNSVELTVPVTGKSLQVDITPDKESYAPRDTAEFTVQVSDESGAPVQAEISLALVDEAIFSLSEELSGPIFEAFYEERPNIVRTYDSMALIRELFMPGMGGGGGAMFGSPRADFQDTAAWFPVVQTDQNGQAVVPVTLPDNLTTWRVTVKAVSIDNLVGEASAQIRTQQSVVVRPILPRILTAGDQVQLSALVHNYSGEAMTFDVSIRADPADLASSAQPLTILGEAAQTISLEPDEVGMLGWTAEALSAGEAAITVQAGPVGESGDQGIGDAVRLPLEIRPLAVPDVVNQVGLFEDDFATTLVIPPNVMDLSTVEIELSRSIAGSLLTGLEYLTGYPYGCVEQTMSKALPNAVVGRALNQLGVSDPTLEADLPAKINAGLQRLYGYQHNDGGWGWWFDDSTNDYQTAWVVFGLAVTSDAGYEVDSNVISRGADWLLSHLESMDLRTRAYSLYSLAVAGHGDLKGTQDMLEHAYELDAFSQAALALALHELGAESQANQMVDLLVESAEQKEGVVYWPTPNEDGHYYQKTMASSVRTTALALDALLKIRPDHPFEPEIVRWLMSQRRQQGWGSTNETSYTILALTDHLLTLETATADTQYAVHLNGQEYASGVLGRQEPAVKLEIPASDLGTGANSLYIAESGQARLYYVIHSRLYFPTQQVEAAGGVSVTRTYSDPDSGDQIQEAQAGQLVRVTLDVDLPDDAFYLIVEDNLPGGLEALNESLNTTSHEQQDYEPESRYYWEEYGYNQKQVFGDRVSFFITEVSGGSRTYSYLARATTSGQFAALPAEVYAMYDLTVWGRSGSSTFTVND